MKIFSFTNSELLHNRLIHLYQLSFKASHLCAKAFSLGEFQEPYYGLEVIRTTLPF